MRTNRRHLWVTALSLALGMAGAHDAHAQSEESEPPPAAGCFEPAPLAPPAVPFVIPDVSHSLAEKAQVRERTFTLKVGVVTLADYTAFSQDSNSLAQVGNQEDQWEARAARLMLRGTIGMDYKVGYLVAAEYKGFESEPEDLWSLTDLP